MVDRGTTCNSLSSLPAENLRASSSRMNPPLFMTRNDPPSRKMQHRKRSSILLSNDLGNSLNSCAHYNIKMSFDPKNITITSYYSSLRVLSIFVNADVNILGASDTMYITN